MEAISVRRITGSISLPITFEKRYPRFFIYFAWFNFSITVTKLVMRHTSRQTARCKPRQPLSPLPVLSRHLRGGTSSGSGFSLKGAWEYQVDPKLFAGACYPLTVPNSYSPIGCCSICRYSLDHAAAQPVSLSPRPSRAELSTINKREGVCRGVEFTQLNFLPAGSMVAVSSG